MDPAPPPPAPTPSFAPILLAEHTWLTFPPFPKLPVPPGVELIAFKDFKPLRIIIPEPIPQGQGQERGEDALEVNGLGIQTLTLRVHHDLMMMEKLKQAKAVTPIYISLITSDPL